MSQNVTIVQIAEESGVSIATVSRVLSGNVPVSPKTRARVEAVIKKYNYTPNSLAQGLILRQSKTLGVIVPDITNPYFSALFHVIECAAHQAHYSVILCNTSFTAASYADGEQENEGTYFQMVLEKKVDGVIIAGGQIDLCEISSEYKAALKVLASSVPVVVIGESLPGIPCSFIDMEPWRGIAVSIRYLASLGHKRIAFIGGERGVTITEARLNAYLSAIQKMHLDTDPELVATSDYYLPDGYSAAKKILGLEKPATAMLAMNDNVAIGAVRAIADYCLSVPDDIAIISCDQFIDGNYLTPRLTSLDRHTQTLGLYVIQYLLSMIQNNDPPEKPDLSPDLVIRESSGKHLPQA